jgi:hypothetical protein
MMGWGATGGLSASVMRESTGMAKRSAAMSDRRRENMPALDFVELGHGALDQTALVI